MDIAFILTQMAKNISQRSKVSDMDISIYIGQKTVKLE